MNYDVLVSVSFRYNIGSVLRTVESFLMDAEWIHPIRRLEYAVCYKLARLGDTISRKLVSSNTAIEKLHEYLAENGETLAQVPISPV
ncbi:unnamed protein product [Acanthocheilonema viteae]|uniref:Uncharacterized protein n=1 Tax=Acanthocheilonema viteae TaxID=6277 RepID=A0A498SEJ5_ACAVI|nr:unnamed protein product [Acanthocheilonema viteae]